MILRTKVFLVSSKQELKRGFLQIVFVNYAKFMYVDVFKQKQIIAHNFCDNKYFRAKLNIFILVVSNMPIFVIVFVIVTEKKLKVTKVGYLLLNARQNDYE